MAGNNGVTERKKGIKKQPAKINSKTGLYVKRDAATGKFMSVKEGKILYKGVTREEIVKMSPVLKRLAEYDKKGT
ncbi:MAG: hypothetical protein H6565_14120 [Lewinellaceae bacterium]|nr:hypothetical protein [Lewinellaceae bacterium]